VVLGSDYPFPLGEQRPGELVEKMESFSQEEKEKILWDNGLEWVGVPEKRFDKEEKESNEEKEEKEESEDISESPRATPKSSPKKEKESSSASTSSKHKAESSESNGPPAKKIRVHE